MDRRQPPIGPNPSDQELLDLLHDYLFLESDTEEQQLAFDAVVDLMADAPEDCWRLIELAAKMDLTDEQTAYFAAGRVEDLLGRHGNAFIDRLELAARKEKLLAARTKTQSGLLRCGLSRCRS